MMKENEFLKKVLNRNNNIGDLIICLKNLKHEGYRSVRLQLGNEFYGYEDDPSPYIRKVEISK
jgi:uncharacterized protein involved in tellurium resistance